LRESSDGLMGCVPPLSTPSSRLLADEKSRCLDGGRAKNFIMILVYPAALLLETGAPIVFLLGEMLFGDSNWKEMRNDLQHQAYIGHDGP
jgi:hypothetical protein